MTARYTDDEKAEAVKKFLEARAAGKSVKEAEKEVGVSNTALYAWIQLAKDESRKIKRATPAEKGSDGRYPEELRARALTLIASGLRIVDISKQIGVPVAALGYWKKTAKPAKRGAGRVPATAEVLPMQMKTANGIGSGGELTDALIYLRHAEKEIMEMVREGKISRPDQAHLLTLLALGVLQKALSK